MSEGTARPPALALYARVIEEMNLRGWDQSELARHAKIGRGTVPLMETNPGKPLARTVNKLADTLGIPRPEAYELAGIAPAKVPPPAAEEPAVVELDAEEAEIQRIQELLDRLPPRQRTELEKIHHEEQTWFKTQLQEARAARQRTLGLLRSRIEAEIELSRRQPPDSDDDQEGGSRARRTMQFS